MSEAEKCNCNPCKCGNDCPCKKKQQELDRELQEAIAKLEKVMSELDDVKEDSRELEFEVEALEDEKEELDDEKTDLQLEYEILEEENENLRIIVNSKEYYAWVGREYAEFFSWLKKKNPRLRTTLDNWYEVFKHQDDPNYDLPNEESSLSAYLFM